MARVEAYPDRARNEIYNLLFADDIDALKPPTPKADLAAVATDEEAESRVRVVAFRRLRADGKAPPGDPPLLGTIVEIALDEGLDTLAAYADGRIRYINHAGGMSMVEDGTALRAQVDGLLLAAQSVVGQIGPWAGDRLPPPPTGQARLALPGWWRPLFRPGAFRSAGRRSNGRTSAEYSDRVVVGAGGFAGGGYLIGHWVNLGGS